MKFEAWVKLAGNRTEKLYQDASSLEAARKMFEAQYGKNNVNSVCPAPQLVQREFERGYGKNDRR